MNYLLLSSDLRPPDRERELPPTGLSRPPTSCFAHWQTRWSALLTWPTADGFRRLNPSFYGVTCQGFFSRQHTCASFGSHCSGDWPSRGGGGCFARMGSPSGSSEQRTLRRHDSPLNPLPKTYAPIFLFSLIAFKDDPVPLVGLASPFSVGLHTKALQPSIRVDLVSNTQYCMRICAL